VYNIISYIILYMVKQIKNKIRTRKYQKGGLFGWGQPEDPYAPKQSWSEWFSGTTTSAKDSANGFLNSANGFLGSTASSASDAAKGVFDSATSVFSTKEQTPLGQQPLEQQPLEQQPLEEQQLGQQPLEQQLEGGKMRRGKNSRSRKLIGGSRGLGLTYYATPVTGLKVAQPTYWEVYGDGHIMKAGSRTKKNRKHKRKQRKSSKRKSHRKH